MRKQEKIHSGNKLKGTIEKTILQTQFHNFQKAYIELNQMGYLF